MACLLVCMTDLARVLTVLTSAGVAWGMEVLWPQCKHIVVRVVPAVKVARDRACKRMPNHGERVRARLDAAALALHHPLSAPQDVHVHFALGGEWWLDALR